MCRIVAIAGDCKSPISERGYGGSSPSASTKLNRPLAQW